MLVKFEWNRIVGTIKYFKRNVWRDFRLPLSALATVARKSFKGQIYCKNWFYDRACYITIADANIGSLKFLNTLFDKFDKY